MIVKEVYSKIIHPAIKELLSYATFEDRIEKELEKYIQLTYRKLYVHELIGSKMIDFVCDKHALSRIFAETDNWTQ